MKRAACINAKTDLYDKDGKLNKNFLKQLKALDVKDLYLFADDIQNEDIKNSSIYLKLVKDLEKEGFKVRKVITAVDPIHNKGIGKAYDDLYLPSVENKKDAGAKAGKFLDAIGSDEIKYKTPAERIGAMFKYFVENKPKDLKSVMYFDPEQAKHDAVSTAAAQGGLACGNCKVLKHENLNETSKFFLDQYSALIKAEVKGDKRGTLDNIKSKWGRDAHSKYMAAIKCTSLLKGEEIAFTKDEYKALSNGRLKALVDCNQHLKDRISRLDPAKPKPPEQSVSPSLDS